MRPYGREEEGKEVNQEQESVEDKIVNAAIECIERYGIKGTTNRRIAALAGVNSAAINYYFRSKDILVKRCMQVTLENAFGEHEFEDLPDGSAEERLEAMFDHLLEGGTRYPGIARAHFYELIAEGKYDSLTVQKLNEFSDRLQQDMREHGARPSDGELKLACLQISSAVMLMILAPRLFEQSFGFDLRQENTRKVFLHRLVARLLA